MRYPVTIKYENKKVTVNVVNKLLCGDFALPDFLKAVREAKGDAIQTTHLKTDYPEKDCLGYETGNERIPKAYLSCFLRAYKLPKKIEHLGYNLALDRKKFSRKDLNIYD